MRIGIFGGAFNPPHIGHVSAAITAAGEHNLDLLLVIPTGTSPHKQMPPETPSPGIRLEMVKNAFLKTAPIIQVSELEIYNTECNYTIDTIKAIEKEYKGAQLFLLVGNDMYNSLDTWKDSGTLLKTVTPILLPREIINISSTGIREMLPQRTGKEYLSELNYSLIIKHRLYGAKPDWEWLRNSAYAMLDSKRIPHVNACEIAAVQLASRWNENADDAREAAILHDITKKLDFSENLCIIRDDGKIPDNFNRYDEKLLHSITAAILAKNTFGVSDTVARAIRLHTTGAAGMTMLDKIIYIADYIESTRDFPGVEELRKAAFDDINRAMCIGLQLVISDLCARGIPVNNATYDALNDLSVA